MKEEDEVRRASQQYYAALASLLSGDARPLMQIWSKSSDVTAMNPYGGREVGWEQLQPVFERVARLCAGSVVSVWLQDSLIRFGGQLAYETGVESGEGIIMGKPVTIRQRVTNIYRHETDGWKMVHRHTDLNPEERDVSNQLHSSQQTEPHFERASSRQAELRHGAQTTARKHEIDTLTRNFFSAVSFLDGKQPAYDRLYTLFTGSGKLIKASADVPEISTVRQFIESRQRMIDAGELTHFREIEIAEITEMFGNVAHRFSTYEKYGINRGVELAGRGAISIQFILTDAGWKISSMAWDDERPGLTLPDKYR